MPEMGTADCADLFYRTQDCQNSFITKATKNHKGHKGNQLIG